VAQGQVPGTPDEVRGFFTRWLDHSNAGDWDAVAAMMHPDIVLTDPMMAEPARGRDAALARARGQYEPFPDGHVVMIGEPFAAVEGPELAYRWRFSGTHLRRIDPPGFAPTGLPVVVEGTSVLRFEGHRVVAASLFFDTTEVARQLLAAPLAGGRLERTVALGQRLRVGVRRRRGRATLHSEDRSAGPREPSSG
jgi:predicted ester cyclase